MKYISITDYLMGRAKPEELSDEQTANLNTLLPKINELLDQFGEYRKCNSGYRTSEDQARINPKAPKSKHLLCAAIDLADADGKLNTWLKAHPKVLVDLDLYCEERQGGWQHIQCLPPKSKKRWFIP